MFWLGYFAPHVSAKILGSFVIVHDAANRPDITTLRHQAATNGIGKQPFPNISIIGTFGCSV
jgi:hypothetical protein